MNTPYTGGCACGALRYTISGEPAAMLDCQCRQCQRDSGTGHQSHLTFVAAAVTTEGEPSHWQSVGDGGTVKRRAFCPTCGSSVFMTFPDMPDVFIVTPASLDEPARYSPQFVTWTSAGHGWDHLDPDCRHSTACPRRDAGRSKGLADAAAPRHRRGTLSSDDHETANLISLIASKFCTPPPTRLVV